MSAKKRNSGKNKGKGPRRGVSGNPQRRAEQLAGAPDGASHNSVGQDSGAVMRDLAFRMAGGTEPAPWWPESHERVLDRARTAVWPSDPVEVEDLTSQIVGDELHDCVRRYTGGHHPAQWLVALAEAAGAALRTALGAGDTEDDTGWRGLWSLLCGIALTAPGATGDDAEGASLLARQYSLPAVKDPRETALAEAGQAAKLLADRGADTGTLAGAADGGGGCRPAGAPLVARDSYGSRFLLAAPFTYEGTEGETHWYAWDVDACWIDEVAGAGSFGSAAGALAEWRDAVGPAADGAELAECPPELAARLLRQPLETGPFSQLMRGDEPRELLREYYRQRRRARELSASLGDLTGGAFVVDLDQAREEFCAWYAARHGRDTVAGGMAEAVDTITDQWGPHKDIDDRAFFACSPHRIETAARLIRNGHYAEHAGPAIRLLPEWTRWCAERGGLSGDAAVRARGAALSAAAALADASAAVSDHPDPGLFRRPE